MLSGWFSYLFFLLVFYYYYLFIVFPPSLPSYFFQLKTMTTSKKNIFFFHLNSHPPPKKKWSSFEGWGLDLYCYQFVIVSFSTRKIFCKMECVWLWLVFCVWGHSSRYLCCNENKKQKKNPRQNCSLKFQIAARDLHTKWTAYSPPGMIFVVGHPRLFRIHRRSLRGAWQHIYPRKSPHLHAFLFLYTSYVLRGWSPSPAPWKLESCSLVSPEDRDFSGCVPTPTAVRPDGL